MESRGLSMKKHEEVIKKMENLGASVQFVQDNLVFRKGEYICVLTPHTEYYAGAVMTTCEYEALVKDQTEMLADIGSCYPLGWHAYHFGFGRGNHDWLPWEAALAMEQFLKKPLDKA